MKDFKIIIDRFGDNYLILKVNGESYKKKISIGEVEDIKEFIEKNK